MAKMDTKDVFDLYFKSIPPETTRKSRAQVDRPEVYAYELELGKQIFDMNVDELFGLLLSFNKSRRFGDKSGFSISYNSYFQITSIYRSIWNFYAEEVELIKNPWYDSQMRGVAATKRLAESKKAFSYEDVKKAISSINNDYDGIASDYGKYLECLLLLFYNGFAEVREIVFLKEDMINFKTKEVYLSGKTIHLSHRCFELLQYVHGLYEIKTNRGTYAAISYKGGYFKIAVRPKEAEKLEDKSPVEVGAMLTRKITMNVSGRYGIDINYRKLYFLGFYDYIVKNSSENRAKELITSIRNSEDAQELMRYAKEYGVVADNVSYIKKLLRPFIQSLKSWLQMSSH